MFFWSAYTDLSKMKYFLFVFLLIKCLKIKAISEKKPANYYLKLYTTFWNIFVLFYNQFLKILQMLLTKHSQKNNKKKHTNTNIFYKKEKLRNLKDQWFYAQVMQTYRHFCNCLISKKKRKKALGIPVFIHRQLSLLQAQILHNKPIPTCKSYEEKCVPFDITI